MIFRRPILVLLAAGGLLAAPLQAAEPTGPFNIHARLVKVVPDTASSGRIAGEARIELLLESFEGTKNIRLDVLRSDGSPWVTERGPFTLSSLRWTRPGHVEPEEVGNGSGLLGKGETARFFVNVPLQGNAIHEFVIRASGEGPQGSVRTQDALRAPLGTSLNLPKDDGVVSEYRAISPGGEPE